MNNETTDLLNWIVNKGYKVTLYPDNSTNYIGYECNIERMNDGYLYSVNKFNQSCAVACLRAAKIFIQIKTNYD